MAAMVPGRTTNPKVLELAKRVHDAQSPEIEQMNGWLARWSAAPSSPSTGMDHGSSGSMPGIDHGSGPGTMPDEDMRLLERASGTKFDRMWLDMMIKHHEGAIEMARTELSQGANADAKALAQKVIDNQQAEITEMRSMLSAR